MTEIIGYWFAADAKLPNGDGRAVVIGETLRVDPPLELCERGLHGSEHPFDALQYAPGPHLYKCRYSGEILRDTDKLCAAERTPIAVIDLTDALYLFARKQALSVVHLWTPPAVVARYLETGDPTIKAAAGDAAWAAVWDAAGDAAWAAARAAVWAAAGDAVWAASAAARDAAGDAAWAAARDAARAAVWAAAGDAVWAAAGDAARKMFAELVEQEFSKVCP